MNDSKQEKDFFDCLSLPLAGVGRCIYCNAVSYDSDGSARPLGGEHIIPQSLGGRLVLPLASCGSCERVTSSVEGCVTSSLVRNNRHELNLKAGEPVDRDHKVAILQMFRYEPPEAISGRRTNEVIAVVGAPLYPDIVDRLHRGGPRSFAFPKGLSDFDFRRMLAKVAHAYAVALFGLRGFQPLLLNAIANSSQTADLEMLVGGEGCSPKAATVWRHSISHSWQRLPLGDALIVSIRLFGNLKLPTHTVVAGLKQKDALGAA